MNLFKKYFFAALFLLVLSSQKSFACACGCGILNVATSSIIPNCQGGTAFLQYDYMGQNRNWNQSSKSNGHNHDKRIETQTLTAGVQYMFNRDWGMAVRVPYVTRYVKNLPHGGSMSYNRHDDIGDIRVNGIYSGLFDDMSTGITFGLKLPTGSTKDQGFARNTQIGTGSTDSILGLYHLGSLGKDSRLGYFAQANWERYLVTHRGYYPGYEVSAATGIFYDAGQLGIAKKITPILQLTATQRGQDSGWADTAHNKNSGYRMAFFAPGIELVIKDFKIYADVELPIYRNVKGNQLVPQNLYKAVLSYEF